MEQQEDFTLNDPKFKRIEINTESGKTYLLRMLGGRDAMVCLAKVKSFMAPVLASGVTEFMEYQSTEDAYNKSLEDENSVYVEAPKLDFTGIASLISDQLDRPDFYQVYELLLSGLFVAEKREGKLYESRKVDLDYEFQGELDLQLNILKVAFERNLATPFVKWLESMGLSGIGSFLQSSKAALLESIGTK